MPAVCFQGLHNSASSFPSPAFSSILHTDTYDLLSSRGPDHTYSSYLVTSTCNVNTVPLESAVKEKNVFFSNESLSHTLQHSATMVITSLSGLSWERNKASMDENSLRTGRRAVRQERNSKEPRSMDSRITKLPKYSTLPFS